MQELLHREDGYSRMRRAMQRGRAARDTQAAFVPANEPSEGDEEIQDEIASALLSRNLALLAPPQLVEHDVRPDVSSRKGVAVQAVELVRLVAFEKRSPFVEAELGMRDVEIVD